MGEWTPVKMLFLLSLIIISLLGMVVVVATFQHQLDVVLPLVSVLMTGFSGTVGGIILFIKLSDQKDKP